jgi:signal transduction histidine kinase
LQKNTSTLSAISEDKRKGIIFTYFVGAIWLISVANTIQNFYVSLTQEGKVAEDYSSYNASNIGFVVFLGLIWLGHRWFPQLMRHVFIIVLIVGTIFFFELEGLGGLLVILTLPIIMAAFLIKPFYSFVYYFFILGVFILRLYIEGFFATYDEELLPFLGLISLIVLAVVSWLIAQSLEKALAEARALNEELDQRVQDRTQKLAEALEREHATAVRNKTILESIADGVLVFDANQQVMIANPAANQLANQDLQSSTLSQLLATLDEKAREVVKTWVQGQKPADQNNVKFDWYQRTISATIAPVPLATDDGRRVGAGNVMVLRDFTKEAELERAKNLFLGMVSHELRTPMSAIKGYVNILLNIEKEHLSDTGYEYLQTIDVSIVQLLSLANELIDLSRIEMGEIELYREWVDLTPIVKQAAKMVQQEFASRNLSLEIKLADSLPKLYVDRNRMLQVLLNLLSNAYKYTPKGGATLEISQAEDRVYIAVTDTGVGIKPADKARMFSRFFRADDHVVQRAGGTGLGLNITKGLVELHGGELTFSSEYGVGTTFQVAIPQNGQVPAEDEKQILDLQPSLE